MILSVLVCTAEKAFGRQDCLINRTVRGGEAYLGIGWLTLYAKLTAGGRKMVTR